MNTPADNEDQHAEPGLSNARILVTGGAGFIGSHLTHLLLEQGADVTVVDNLSTGRRANLPDHHERLRFLEADLTHALAAFGGGERFDAIYHLAAAVGVRLIVDEPIRCIETNIDETANLLRFALDHGPDGGPATTLIASSSEVYGKADRDLFSEEDDVVYGPTTRSRWSYAAAKAIDEYLALAYHTKHELPSVVVRFFNTVGPRQIGRYGMVLPNFVQAALAGHPIQVYGDGEQVRCFCDVRDVVRGLPRLVEGASATGDTTKTAGRVFNLGSDSPISINDLASTVIRVLDSKSSVEHVPYDRAYSAGFEDLRRRRPDLRRIREAIGFEPRLSLEQTIRDLASWMSNERGAP